MKQTITTFPVPVLTANQKSAIKKAIEDFTNALSLMQGAFKAVHAAEQQLVDLARERQELEARIATSADRAAISGKLELDQQEPVLLRLLKEHRAKQGEPEVLAKAALGKLRDVFGSCLSLEYRKYFQGKVRETLAEYFSEVGAEYLSAIVGQVYRRSRQEKAMSHLLTCATDNFQEDFSFGVVIGDRMSRALQQILSGAKAIDLEQIIAEPLGPVAAELKASITAQTEQSIALAEMQQERFLEAAREMVAQTANR